MSSYSTGRTRPFTGQEYLESLRDGREIWIYGERVKDVTTHPAFRNTVRMIARLYDALHDPAKQATLTMERRYPRMADVYREKSQACALPWRTRRAA
jgi:4-hydroxyphenylacetate 3-monooxygenase